MKKRSKNGQPYNILYFSSFGDLGRGGQESLFQLVTNLDKSRFHAIVIIPSEGSLAHELNQKGIEVTVLELPKVLDWHCYQKLWAFYNLFKFTNQQEIDILHTDGPRNTFYAGIISKLKNIPLVWHIRSSTPDPFDLLLHYLSSKMILVAESIRERFWKISKSNKFCTIYNGIDFLKFNPTQSTSTVREHYRIACNTILIATVAIIEKRKGHIVLIEALKKLINKVMFHAIMVGDVVESDYYEKLKNQLKEYGISDRITFARYQKNIPDILKTIDIFVLPSLYGEAFPRSILEAMATGKPVIATDVGGCSEAVEHNVTGFIVPPGDPDKLAENILELAKNPELRKRMGYAGKIRAEKMFSIQEHVRHVQQVYDELLAE